MTVPGKKRVLRNVERNSTGHSITSGRSRVIHHLDCGHEVVTALPRNGGKAYERARTSALAAKKRVCPYGCTSPTSCLTVTARCEVCVSYVFSRLLTCRVKYGPNGEHLGYVFPEHKRRGTVCERSGAFVTIGESV